MRAVTMANTPDISQEGREYCITFVRPICS